MTLKASFSISAVSVGQEELENKALNQDRGQTGSWLLDTGEAMFCDHRRWGICDRRKARYRRRTAKEEA
jgi:hypothetical protein